MRYKGGIKIIFLLLIMIVIGLSAIMFSFEDQGITQNIQNKAQETIKDGGEKVIDKVAEEGRVVVGEKLKETGEKMISESVTPGIYMQYDANISMDHEKTILFFTAPWCPSCIEAEQYIDAQKKMIPQSVAIYVVDFDAHGQLREKYHVERPHTFVQINADGSEIAQWNGGKTVDDLIAKMQ